MSMANPGGVNWIRSTSRPQTRITVEDLMDGLIARVSKALPPDASSTDASADVTAQVQQVVQLAQQLKDAVGKLRQLDPTLLSSSTGAFLSSSPTAPPASS